MKLLEVTKIVKGNIKLGRQPSSYVGVVTGFAVDSNKQPYAVCEVPGIDGSVIFYHKNQSVWKEDSDPDIRSEVVLSDLRKYDKGWRAKRARPLTPED